MKSSSVFFMAFSAVIALVGLFAWSAAADLGMTIFSVGLTLFGVLFGLSVVKRHFDAEDAARH